MVALASAVTAVWAPSGSCSDSLHNGASGMLEPRTGSLLVQFYETFLRDQDIEAFRRHVSARYSEGTLARLVESGPMQAPRAAVLSLGLFGGLENNATLARTLRRRRHRPEPGRSRTLGHLAPADTPENNATLERVRDLITRRLLDQAIELATRLVERAPGFAEAYNQRAIGRFLGTLRGERGRLPPRPAPQSLPLRRPQRAGEVPAPARPAPGGPRDLPSRTKAPASQ